jgi:hypothetical protein
VSSKQSFDRSASYFVSSQKHFRSCTIGSANCKSTSAAALMVLQIAKVLPQLHEWFCKLQKCFRSCTNGLANCKSASATARMVMCRHKSRSATNQTFKSITNNIYFIDSHTKDIYLNTLSRLPHIIKKKFIPLYILSI